MSTTPPALDTQQVGDESGATNGQKRKHEEEPLTTSGRSKQYALSICFFVGLTDHVCRKKQDSLLIEARHVGRTLDAFVTPGAMLNYGVESMVTSTTTEAELDDNTTNE
jgi:hypothetical protein